MSPTPCPYALWDASYVLGSLVPAERREYEAHLSGCERCSAQVAELAGIGPLLSLVPAGEDGSVSSPVPGDSETAVASLVGRVRRRRVAWVAAAAAAAVVLAGGTAAVTASVVGSSPPSAVQAATDLPGAVPLSFAAQGPAGIVATGALVPRAWGTDISWECSYAAGPGDYVVPGASWGYVLVVVSHEGEQIQVASWSASAGSVVSPGATTSLALGAIASVDIRRSLDSPTLLRATP